MTKESLSKNSYQKALNTAVRLLSLRDHTRLEIQQKLKQRRFSREVIDKVVSECERLNYINDERTARIYISQLARRGFGYRRIRLELKKKGLKGDRFEVIIKERISDIDEKEIAERILQKKMKRFKREGDHKKRRDKIYRFLYARGFQESVISEMLRKFI